MTFAPTLQRSETAAEMIGRLSVPIPEAGCYAWLGAHSRGYAKMQWYHGRSRRSARVARYLCEPVPSGYEVDHLCRMRWCVNPDHLELVSHQENIRRHWARVDLPQTCEKHPDVFLKYEGRQRVCRVCKREYVRLWRARQKEKFVGKSEQVI